MASDDRYWSVTELIKLGTPAPGLIGWAANTCARYALENARELYPLWQKDPDAAVKVAANSRFETTKKAAERGTEVHRVAEALAYGQTDVTFDEDLYPYVANYQDFLDEFSPTFEMAEAAVYNHTHRYAGTLDSIAVIDGQRVCLDIKTTEKGPDARTRPPYSEVALQLAAYRHAEVVSYSPLQFADERSRRYYMWQPDMPTEPMPETDGAMALIVSPVDYVLRSVVVDREVFNYFLSVIEVAAWSADTSQRVIGPAVKRKATA